jgi:hypothetical protein
VKKPHSLAQDFSNMCAPWLSNSHSVAAYFLMTESIGGNDSDLVRCVQLLNFAFATLSPSGQLLCRHLAAQSRLRPSALSEPRIVR